MPYNQLVQFYFDRSNALQWYWTVYVVVIGGLLAFSSLRVRPDRLTAVLITILYLCFAYKNLGAIHDVTLQRAALLDLIHHDNDQPAESPEARAARSQLEPTLVQPGYPGTRNFHVMSDLLVVAALWAMERRRDKQSNATAPTR